MLRYYEGLADHEIAALLSCREASVRSLARRGLTAMRPLVAAGSTEGGRFLAGHQQVPVRQLRGSVQAARLSCPAKYASAGSIMPLVQQLLKAK